MGVLDSLGVGNIAPNIDASTIWSYAGTFAGLILVGLVTFALFFGISFLKGKRYRFDTNLHWFETIQDRMVPIDEEKCEQLVIPGTTIRIFKTKEGRFLPAGTRPMGKKSYWVCRTRTGEIIYFALKDINKDLEEVGLDYDHGDARAMNENLRDLIKRAYTDKSTRWWQEYKEVISLAIIVFVMALAVVFVLGKAEKVIAATEPTLILAQEVMAESRDAMNALSNVCSNIKPVSGFKEEPKVENPGNET